MSVSGPPAIVLQQASLRAAPGAATAVLQGLNLRIEPGEQVALIGASGAGKTTLLLALAAALPLAEGTLTLFGHDPWRLPRRALQRLRGELAYAPQVPPLPPRQRVVNAVLAGRLPRMGLWHSLRTLWHPGDAPLAQAALSAVDLPSQLWQRVDRLSGGERQRVGLARLLASDARLWLVDEPLSALDPARATQVMDALTAAAQRDGRTLVCSLHQVAVARERFARVLALKNGALVYDGPGAGLDAALLTRLYGSPAAPDEPAAPRSPAEPALPIPASLPQTMCR